MATPIPRRRFLGASAGAALLAVGATPAAGSGACEEYRDLREDLDRERDTLQRLRAERDSLVADVGALRETIQAGRDAARGPHPYDQATRETAAAVGVEARPGMVYLEMTDDTVVDTASAWFVEEHLLLTNNHNVEDLTPGMSRTFWTVDGERHEFEVVDRAEVGPDIALLRTESSAPEVLPTGASDDLAVGDLLVQVGNPGGFGKWVLTLGELLEPPASGADLVTSVPGLQGVSGSPVLDMDGRVVGVTFAGQPKTSWEPGQVPAPSSTEVEVYPMAPDSNALHVPIEDALELKEEWT